MEGVPMNRRIIKVAVVSTAAGVAVGTIGVVLLVRHLHKRRQHKGQFLSNRKRRVITEFLEQAASDIPHGPVGAVAYRTHLQGMSDKRLVILYAALRIGEYLRDAGIDPAHATAEQLKDIKALFSKTEVEAHNREGMLSALLAHDFSDIKPLLIAALGILVLV